MKTMKKMVAALLVLTMVMALAGTALAACNIKAGMWVEFKKDSNSYTEAKSGKMTKNVVQKGSVGYCDKVSGKYARVLVNEAAETYRWFKKDNLKAAKTAETKIVWAKGGKGMSTCMKETIVDAGLKGKKVKVTGHTNLRKNPGMKFKSQGVVEKGDMLKLTGRLGMDDRYVLWLEVSYKGKNLWVSINFVKKDCEGMVVLY